MLTTDFPRASVDPTHRALIDETFFGQALAHTIRDTPDGAALREVLLCPAARDYLISYCLNEAGAHRVLGFALALGRGAEHAEHAVAAYTTAAFAALALGHRERGILLLGIALEAEENHGSEYALARLLMHGICQSHLPAAAYREIARRTRCRLR